MSSNNRVVWYEGLFLKPQHFQQNERFVERYVELRTRGLRPNSWGFDELELERDPLTQGRLALRRARGVFPDGTPFSMPDDDPLPPVFEVPADTRNAEICLTLPLRRAGAVETLRKDSPTSFARFSVQELDARDATVDTAVVATVEVAAMRSRLAVSGPALADFACIPVARVVERSADGRVLLDDGFMPTALRVAAAPALAAFVRELEGILHQRADSLARAVAVPGRSGSIADMNDFLFLHTCNRFEPMLKHWARAPNLHPEEFYLAAVTLAGELATLLDESKRPPEFPLYEHARLRESFAAVIDDLRAKLSGGHVPKVFDIPLTERKNQLWAGPIKEKALVGSATFVLAVAANVPADDLRRRIPAVTKIASAERINEYILSGAKGVALSALAQVPRQLPYHADFVYFALDSRSPEWAYLKTSAGIAVQIDGQFPGIRLELWAIRE